MFARLSFSNIPVIEAARNWLDRLFWGKGYSLREEPGLEEIVFGLRWDTRYAVGPDFDVNISLFMLGADGRVPSREHFIFYEEPASPCGSVIHRFGGGEADNEQIVVYLNEVPPAIQKLAVAITISGAGRHGQTFGQIHNGFARIADRKTDCEIARFDLSEGASTETAVVFGELYRREGYWKFSAIGQGYACDLDALARVYGVFVG